MSTNSKAYELITNAIIAGLESGKVAWRRPWSTMRPFNPSSKTEYRGVNTFVLSLYAFTDPRWMTFKQIEAMGGKVRKGEKGTPIVFWKQIVVEDKDTGKKKNFPLLKHFYVWNVEQVEGLTLPELEQVKKNSPLDSCEAIVKGMEDAPEISHGGARACYYPSTDKIQMPQLELFENSEAYYCTLFHELGHSTGHTSRLNRDEVMKMAKFGDENYSREELVAELCAAFLCQAAGIDNDQENTTAYVKGWLRALKDDPTMIVWAAGRAAKAADYVLGNNVKPEAVAEEEETKELVAV